MKYALLGMNSESSINIGDYIQAVAAAQFIPKIDGFIQREKLDQYHGDLSAIIMNGWFMHHPQNWPPSDKLRPLFVAFHLNVLAEKELLGEESIKYLRKFEPIGCRDIRTFEKLRSKGVDAYFSGCLTLTLGEKYKSHTRGKDIYFVDVPIFESTTKSELFKDLIHGLRYHSIALHLAKQFGLKECSLRVKLLFGGRMIRHYKTYFSLDILRHVKFINHTDFDCQPDENLFNTAESLVKKYASAKLVVTSRIHCALPCLGLETPVIYLDNTGLGEVSNCRLDGLRELFNTLDVSDGALKATSDFSCPFIDTHNIPRNKDTWYPLAKSLIERVKTFVKNIEEK